MKNCNYTFKGLKELAIIMVFVLPLSFVLSGFRSQEKSYYYYTKNPTELMEDYKYCSNNSGMTRCDNIVAKYNKYNKELSKARYVENSLNSAIIKQLKAEKKKQIKNYKVSIFNDLDQDIEINEIV